MVELLRAMRLFVTAVQAGSLSAAGRQLGLSPASASRHVTDLEEQLGGRLLNRTSRKLTLTEAGQMYFQRVEQILQQVAEANESVSQFESVPRGTLRVHSRMLVAHLAIVPALPHFLASYPEIRLDLMLSNFPVDLVAHNIDLDIRTGKLADSALVARKLASSVRMVCAAPGYLDAHAPIDNPADLAAHNCLFYSRSAGRMVWHFMTRDGVQTEVPVSGTLQSDNGQALLAAVRAGIGIALMPDWAIRDDLKAGRLRRLFPEHRVSHTDLEDGVYAVYQRSRHMSPKLRVFIDFIGATFRERERPFEG